MRGELSATDYDRLASIADEYRRILRTHILPAIGGKRIVDVRPADAARLHAGLVRTPYEANRTLAVGRSGGRRSACAASHVLPNYHFRETMRILNSVNTLISFIVRAAGIEPALCRQNWILSPARLPVPPRPHAAASSSHSSCGATLLRLSIAPICHDSEHQVQPHPARNAGVEIVYSAASFTGAGPARNCSSSPCSSALAAFKCFVFTWP
jgi:hypothetical protein